VSFDVLRESATDCNFAFATIALRTESRNAGSRKSVPFQTQVRPPMEGMTTILTDEESVRFLRDENKRLRSELGDVQRSMGDLEARVAATSVVRGVLG